MKRRKIIYDPVLIIISVLGIAAFQVYWLKQNYDREAKSLGIKTEMAFRQTMMKLQAAKLKLDLKTDSVKDEKMHVFIGEDHEKTRMRFSPREEIVSTINVLRDRYEDSLREKMNMVVEKINVSGEQKDSIKHFEATFSGPGGNRIFRLLYDVDSLQDSITIHEIDSAYSRALKKQNLSVPFYIIKKDSAFADGENDTNEVTIGFSHPVTYKLAVGNTFPFLMKRILLPVIFSLLLLGITILAFILMYKNLVKQKRLAAIKNEFISNMTHELKTPIATMGVAIEALKNFNAMQDTQRTREYLDISSHELQRLGLLVDKVLKLSMFENKGIELKYENIDLNEIVNEVVSSFRLQSEKLHADLRVASAGNLHLQGDRLHLLSVIFNLVDNALKYSTENPVIRISMKEEEKNIIIRVEDNGIGIPEEYKNKIFDKFFRVPRGNTHDTKGYGLGLSYAAQVIAEHRGTITVENTTGKGTTFVISLPKNPV
jgi:two-component system phosphate regulon sensor histidine kinase PhoR